MSVTAEHEQEGIIEAEVVGQDKIAVVESMSEPTSDGRVPEESIARTVIPYYRDDDKARWLGYRACGFTSAEATQLIGKTKSCISNWRADPEFADLEKRLPEFRKALANEYCEIEFVRNFRLVMEKDHQIIKKALEVVGEFFDAQGKKIDIPNLTKQENDYLLKMRAYYTPQQLSAISALTRSGTGSQDDDIFDFTKAVISFAEHSRTVEMKVGR